jgi:hypothetical protein
MGGAFDYKGSGAGLPKPWAVGTSYKVGDAALDATDFCYYIRKVEGSGGLTPSADTTNWQNSNGFRSIQRGTGTATVTSVTLSPAVNIAKCTVYCVGAGKDAGGAFGNVISGQLTNSTTLAVSGSGTYTGGGTFAYEVAERF